MRANSLIEVLARGGRYTCAGAIAGPIVELDLREFYLRDLSFFGCTVPSPENFENIVQYIENREINPILAASYDLEQFHAAQEQFIGKNHVGNIVVVP